MSLPAARSCRAEGRGGIQSLSRVMVSIKAVAHFDQIETARCAVSYEESEMSDSCMIFVPRCCGTSVSRALLTGKT